MILDIVMVIMNDSRSHWVSWIRIRQSVKRIIKILFIVFHGHDKGRWITQAAKIPKNKGTSWLYIFDKSRWTNTTADVVTIASTGVDVWSKLTTADGTGTNFGDNITQDKQATK